MSAEIKQLQTDLEVAERSYRAADDKLTAAYDALDEAQSQRLAAGREVGRLRALHAKAVSRSQSAKPGDA